MIVNTIENNIDLREGIARLSSFLNRQQNIDECLSELASILADVLKVDECSIIKVEKELNNNNMITLQNHIISAPIKVEDRVIAVIYAYSFNKRIFTEEDLQILEVLAFVISQSIQIMKLKGLLNSKYTMCIAEREAKKSMESTVALAIYEPERLAKLLAKTFYKEMVRAGFGPNHIINAASEIISLLNNNLNRCKKRLKNTNT